MTEIANRDTAGDSSKPPHNISPKGGLGLGPGIPHSGEPVSPDAPRSPLTKVAQVVDGELTTTLETPADPSAINPETLDVNFEPARPVGLSDAEWAAIQALRAEPGREPKQNDKLNPWQRAPLVAKIGLPLAAAAAVFGGLKSASQSSETGQQPGNNAVSTPTAGVATAAPVSPSEASPRPTDLPRTTTSPEASDGRVEPRLGMTDAELDAAFAMHVGPDATAEQIVNLFNQRELDLFHYGLKLPDTAAYDWKKTEAGETRTDNIIQQVMAQDDVLYDALFDAKAFAGNSIRQEQDAARNTFAQAVVTDISYERVVNGGTLPARYKPIHKEVTVSDIQEVWRKKVKEGTLVGIRWKARSKIDYTNYELKVIGRTKAGLPIVDMRTDTGGMVFLIGPDGRMYAYALGPESL